MPHSLRYKTSLSPSQGVLNYLLKHNCFPKSDRKGDYVVLFCQQIGRGRTAGLENESPKFENSLNRRLLAVISQVSHSLICYWKHYLQTQQSFPEDTFIEIVTFLHRILIESNQNFLTKSSLSGNADPFLLRLFTLGLILKPFLSTGTCQKINFQWKSGESRILLVLKKHIQFIFKKEPVFPFYCYIKYNTFYVRKYH